jgi:hypothetical protein
MVGVGMGRECPWHPVQGRDTTFMVSLVVALAITMKYLVSTSAREGNRDIREYVACSYLLRKVVIDVS